MDRLKAMYDTLRILQEDKDGNDKVLQEAVRMTRVLTVLREYISEYDSEYTEERTILPMARYVKLFFYTIFPSVWSLKAG